jgi:voltage-gated potassium channel
LLAFWKVVWGLIRDLAGDISDPAFRPVFGLLAVTIAVGSLFYWRVEHWSLLNSIYFSVITICTVGFGDFSPHTAVGKIFTTLYVLVGVGIIGLFVNAVSRRAMRESHAIQRAVLEERFGREISLPTHPDA